MKRPSHGNYSCFLLSALLLATGPTWWTPVFAQQPDDKVEPDTPGEVEMGGEEDVQIDLPPEPEPPSDEALEPSDSDIAPTSTAPLKSPEELRKAREATWKDIVVIPRKSFLKRNRVEITPFIGTTINDTLIQHTALGAEINYFLTDILAIGVQGIYYLDNVLDDEFFVRYHFGRVASLNRYRYCATGNFSYVPIYGKFAILNKVIAHYEVWLSGGVGVTGTEVIPRDFDNESFSNFSLTFPVGIGTRFFLTRWMALQVSLRDYMMLDKFEEPGRDIEDGDQAKQEQSETRFVNNLMLSAGVSFFLPFDFKYTTYR